MQDHKTRLKRLLCELDDLAVFDPSGELVLFNANEYERMLERADGLTVRDSRRSFQVLDLPIV
jgi:hypothetical protein